MYRRIIAKVQNTLYYRRSEKKDLLRVYDVEPWQAVAELSDFNPNYSMGNNKLAINADGTYVAAGNKRDVLVWESDSGEQRHRLSSPGHGAVQSVAFTRDGARVIGGYTRHSGGPPYGRTHRDSGIYAWDVETGELARQFRGHTDGVVDLACTPDGQRLVSLGADNTIRIWDLAER